MTIHVKSRFAAGKAIVAGAIGVAGLAAANHLIARRSERTHPPQGDFVEVGGVRLHYTDRGIGTPVVLIHGNALAANDWDASGVSDLLVQGHRVIAFDRPGCGHSERPRGKVWTAAAQGEVLYQAMVELGLEKPVLVGHSFGTLVALSIAQRHEADIAGLVLVSGYYFWTLRPDVVLAAVGAFPGLGGLLRHTLSPALGRLQVPLLKWAMFSPASAPDRFEAEFSPAMMLRPSQIRATSVDGALMIPGVVGLRKNYKNMDMPVTIIAGDGDKIVFKRGAERLRDSIKDSTLQIVEGAGHMVHYFAPKKVAAAVESVLAKTR